MSHCYLYSSHLVIVSFLSFLVTFHFYVANVDVLISCTTWRDVTCRRMSVLLGICVCGLFDPDSWRLDSCSGNIRRVAVRSVWHEDDELQSRDCLRGSFRRLAEPHVSLSRGEGQRRSKPKCRLFPVSRLISICCFYGHPGLLKLRSTHNLHIVVMIEMKL